MLSKFLKKNRPILAISIVLIIFVVYVYIHKDVIEGIKNMTKSKCNMEECKKNCPDLDVKCLKDHAEYCGDCKFSVSDLSDQIEKLKSELEAKINELNEMSSENSQNLEKIAKIGRAHV